MTRIPAITLLCFFALASCTRHEVVTHFVEINDPVFLAYCLNAKDMDGKLRIDIDGDGIIAHEEAAQVEEIYLDNEGGDLIGKNDMPGVKSLAGIEYFTKLRRLSLGNNSVETLDLSRNSQLTYLNCADNRLFDLDLSANALLETLNCNNNNLAELDISMLPTLKYLYCTNNAITRLDVGGTTALVELSCDRNKLRSLDVGGCNALTDLSCAGNGLTSISLPENSALVRLDCGTHERGGVSKANELTELDLSGQDKLSLLRANVNPLISLDISECASLRTLECVGCRLSSLDITANTRLRLLFCNGNPEGMKIYVAAGFDSSKFLSWVIGTATVTEKT